MENLLTDVHLLSHSSLVFDLLEFLATYCRLLLYSGLSYMIVFTFFVGLFVVVVFFITSSGCFVSLSRLSVPEPDVGLEHFCLLLVE